MSSTNRREAQSLVDAEMNSLRECSAELASLLSPSELVNFTLLLHRYGVIERVVLETLAKMDERVDKEVELGT